MINSLSLKKDRNHDGRIDRIQTYHEGRLVRELHDDDFDGQLEKIITHRTDRVVLIEPGRHPGWVYLQA